MARPKKPVERVLDHVLKVRLNSGIMSVVEQARLNRHCETVSDLVRELIQEECDRVLMASQFPEEKPF